MIYLQIKSICLSTYLKSTCTIQDQSLFSPKYTTEKVFVLLHYRVVLPNLPSKCLVVKFLSSAATTDFIG